MINAYLCCLLAASVGATEEPQIPLAFELLDKALTKAWVEPDPRRLIMHVLSTAIQVDPGRSLDRIRSASDRLARQMLLPDRQSVQGSLAPLVAPHDRKLRDLILQRAIAEARDALATKTLWKAPTEKPPGIFGFFPQRELDQQKELLSQALRLWECINSQDKPDVSMAKLKKLLADAKAKGDFGSDAFFSYEQRTLKMLAALDPTLLLAIAPKIYERPKLAKLCFIEADRRWLDQQRDSFTGALITYAVKNGVISKAAFRIFKHYDFAQAWKLADSLQADPNDTRNPRQGILVDLVVDWAWRDPDAALAAAEKEADEFTRREMLDRVAKVWAYKKPDQIERAVRNQDTPIRKEWAREAATAELAWRKQGNPPRDNPKKVPPKEISKGPRANPEEERILENPKDTAWLKGPKREMYLRQAGSVAYFRTGKLDGIQQIIAGLKNQEEIDDILSYNAELIARAGNPKHAVELLNRIQAPGQFVITSCWVARYLVDRSER